MLAVPAFVFPLAILVPSGVWTVKPRSAPLSIISLPFLTLIEASAVFFFIG